MSNDWGFRCGQCPELPFLQVETLPDMTWTQYSKSALAASAEKRPTLLEWKLCTL